jgi:hypothetical protein
MAGLIPAGTIVDPRQDRFATSGAHLDLRIIPQFGPQKGKRINPETARSVLQNVLIGPNKTPVVQQVGDQWRWNFPITSKFGPRNTGIPGASTYHEGIDIAHPSITPGTPIAYKGYGTYQPDRGFGTIRTTDPQGNRYDIQLLHTKPGARAAVGSNIAPNAPQLSLAPGTQPPQANQQQDTRTSDILSAFLYGTEYQKGQKQQEARPGLRDQLVAGLFSQALKPQSTFISRYIQEEPYLQGQASSTYDYLAGQLL